MAKKKVKKTKKTAGVPAGHTMPFMGKDMAKSVSSSKMHK